MLLYGNKILNILDYRFNFMYLYRNVHMHRQRKVVGGSEVPTHGPEN